MSAQSSLNQANRNAQKYATTTAQAQGFSTQGMAQQNMTDLQNMYMNSMANQNTNYMQQVANVKDNASNNAYALFSQRLANTLGGAYNQSDIQKLIDAYVPQMNETARREVMQDLQNISSNSFDASKHYTKFDFNNADLSNDSRTLYDKSRLKEFFGKDIIDQKYGAKTQKVLSNFAYDMKYKPNELNGKYFNMNVGNGQPKYYYVENGVLYKVNSVPAGQQAINISDYYVY